MMTSSITENSYCDGPKAANAVVRLLPAQRNMIDYMVACVNDYADRHGLSAVESFDYLSRYKGLDFLEECYEVEHTLPLDTALDDLEAICRRNERAPA